MAGIYQEGEHKVLSGVYSRIVTTLTAMAAGNRGVVTYPFFSDWGPVNELKIIGTAEEFRNTFNGRRTTLSGNLVHELAFAAKPRQVLAYRIAGNTAAKGTATLSGSAGGNPIVLETLYPSTRAIVAVVKAGIVAGVTLEFIENGVLLEKHEATTADDLIASINRGNVARSGTVGAGMPSVTAGVQFTGGDNGSTVTVAEYETYLNTVFADGTAHAIALPGVTDAALLATVQAWAEEVRAQGFYISLVRGGAATWDADLTQANTASQLINKRYTINVGNGVDGYTAAAMAVYVAARVASVPLNQSLTDELTDFGAVNNLAELTPTNRITAKQAGTLLFVKQGSKVVIDEGVNTLTVPGANERAEFGKIRVNNTLDTVLRDLEEIGDAYKRTKSNTEEAREIYAATVEDTYLKGLIGQEVLQPGSTYRVDPEWHGPDHIYQPKIDEAYFVSELLPVDSMEKIYQKFGVSFE